MQDKDVNYVAAEFPGSNDPQFTTATITVGAHIQGNVEEPMACDDCILYREAVGPKHPNGCCHPTLGTFESFKKKPLGSCKYQVNTMAVTNKVEELSICDDCYWYRNSIEEHTNGCVHPSIGTFAYFKKKPLGSLCAQMTAKYCDVKKVREDLGMNKPVSEQYHNMMSIMDTPTNPKHYNQFKKHEPWDVIEEWCLPFSLGNVVKYIARAGHKESSTLLEDLKKAKTYLDKYIERIEKGEIKR